MKTLPILVASLLIFASCQSKKTDQDSPVIASSDNEKLLKDYFEKFNQHNWKEMAAMYADTAEFKDPSLGQGIVKQSHEQIIKKYGELQQMIPDVRDSLVNMYPSGDKHMIVEFISTGTAPDKSKFTMPICTIFTIVDGKITQDFTYYDNFTE
ncbi:nuclear transport factor 2 family protein [Dyadobacter sp. CY327]|uniref:nuclear transport factor 2 family protein n=1 Tax=Dyadobacter sp. CY327 TaxID=2907301 RepID=UPI001F463513|nr:nuclear transport factor 2 family protein [Dyadobacter sp. CY327]MCE7070994.1 nuclear transport factor 2 family protein [Dyadobacter sp. CY327]